MVISHIARWLVKHIFCGDIGFLGLMLAWTVGTKWVDKYGVYMQRHNGAHYSLHYMAGA